MSKKLSYPLRLGGGLLLCAVATLAYEPAAKADTFQESLANASQLMAQNRLREALRAYQEAYAMQQVPSLFLYMARLRLQLGEGKEALEDYRRFLIAVPSPEPAQQKEAEQQIARLSAMSEPPVQAPTYNVPYSTVPNGLMPPMTPQQLDMLLTAHSENSERARLSRRNAGLIAGGSVLMSLGYIAAFSTGITFLSESNSGPYYGSSSSSSSSSPSKSQWTAANALLVVPIIGPVFGGLVYPQVWWTLPWIIVDGAAQIGGLAMIIMGAKSNHRLGMSKKLGLADLTVIPNASPAFAGLTVGGRF